MNAKIEVLKIVEVDNGGSQNNHTTNSPRSRYSA